MPVSPVIPGGGPAPRVDTHVHTALCNHASGSMEEYVQAAVARDLQGIIFLEHLEAGIEYVERTWLTEEDFTRYFSEGERLRERYRDRISIRLGVEIGYNPRAIRELQEQLGRFPWDWLGLSYHFYHDGSRYLNMVSRRKENLQALAAAGAEKVTAAYLTGLIEAVQILDCNVLCHLDAVMRHHPGLQSTPAHQDQVEQLLTAMAGKHMYLEVNTSGFALRGEPYPGSRIIARAREMGIPLTAGSDAHRPDQVGRYFERLPEFLASTR